MEPPKSKSDDNDDDTAAINLPDPDLRRWARRHRRDRLLSRVADLHREIHKPLSEIVRDHALAHLPAAALLRLQLVHPSWARQVSSPLFHLAQTRAHRSPSGLFFRPSLNSSPSFAAFAPSPAPSLPDPALSYLPRGGLTVRSSSHGLACCFAPFPSPSLFVTNPATREWAPIPEPSMLRGIDPNLAVIFDPSARNFAADYLVVHAFQVGDEPGLVGFESYSSDSGEWRVSAEFCSTEWLTRGSGVSAGGAAYWKTTMWMVVGHDPAADVSRSLMWPNGYDDGAVEWELGEVAGGRLGCVSVTSSAVVVHALGAGDEWVPVGRLLVRAAAWRWGGEEGEEACVGGRLRPVRFGSGSLEVMVWEEEGGRVVGLDLAGRKVREVEVAGTLRWELMELVPHVSTLVPVKGWYGPARSAGGA